MLSPRRPETCSASSLEKTVLVLADEKRGLAIPAKADSQRLMGLIFSELEGK